VEQEEGPVAPQVSVLHSASQSNISQDYWSDDSTLWSRLSICSWRRDSPSL